MKHGLYIAILEELSKIGRLGKAREAYALLKKFRQSLEGKDTGMKGKAESPKEIPSSPALKVKEEKGNIFYIGK